MTDFRKWLKDMIRIAEKAGWTVTVNKHVKFKSPDGKIVCCSSTPRHHEAIHWVRRDLKKIDFPFPADNNP